MKNIINIVLSLFFVIISFIDVILFIILLFTHNVYISVFFIFSLFLTISIYLWNYILTEKIENDNFKGEK